VVGMLWVGVLWVGCRGWGCCDGDATGGDAVGGHAKCGMLRVGMPWVGCHGWGCRSWDAAGGTWRQCRAPCCRGAAGGLPRKPPRQPDPARPRAAVLHPALREIRLQVGPGAGGPVGHPPAEGGPPNPPRPGFLTPRRGKAAGGRLLSPRRLFPCRGQGADPRRN